MKSFYATVELEFHSEVEDVFAFADELDGVLRAISFGEAFESNTVCANFTITEVNS